MPTGRIYCAARRSALVSNQELTNSKSQLYRCVTPSRGASSSQQAESQRGLELCQGAGEQGQLAREASCRWSWAPLLCQSNRRPNGLQGELSALPVGRLVDLTLAAARASSAWVLARAATTTTPTRADQRRVQRQSILSLPAQLGRRSFGLAQH